MGNCQNCVHSKLDEQWGEYKCMKYHRRIYILLEEGECANYEKDPSKKITVESKKKKKTVRRTRTTRS